MTKYIILPLFLLVMAPIAFAVDSDMDGITDSQDPYPLDYDNDQLPDSWETKNGLPFDRDNALEDPDNDGLANYDEFKFGTNPNSADTDGDGISDKKELETGLNPLERNFRPGIWTISAVLIGLALLVAGIILFRKRDSVNVQDQVARMEALRRQAMSHEMVERIKLMASEKKQRMEQQKAFYNNNRGNNQNG